jgi:hypothetical protein
MVYRSSYPSNEGPRNNNNPPVANNHRSHLHSHMGPDDLQSYERAVLARKTNINLNLPRKRHGTTSGALLPRQGRRFRHRPHLAASSHPAYRATSPLFFCCEIRASSTSSESDGGDGKHRPSFKRLPSTTLEPTYSKRTLLSMPNGSEDYAESNNSTCPQRPIERRIHQRIPQFVLHALPGPPPKDECDVKGEVHSQFFVPESFTAPTLPPICLPRYYTSVVYSIFSFCLLFSPSHDSNVLPYCLLSGLLLK